MERRMEDEDTTRIEAIPIALPNNAKIYVRAAVAGGREQVVAPSAYSFGNVALAIEGVAQSITGVWERVKPAKATIEFGVQIGVESGQLTTLFVKGTGSADLKVTMEWSLQPEQKPGEAEQKPTEPEQKSGK